MGLAMIWSGEALAGTDTDTGVDCGIEEWRCDEQCSCEARFDEDPCNDPPDGILSVSYPTTADPVEVLCPTIFMSGAHDPENLTSNLYYRVEIAAENEFAVLVYDSGLISAAGGTTQHQVGNDVYPRPLEAGGNYWIRVADHDDCSDGITGVYYPNPNPLLVNFSVADDATDNCVGGDADTDADTDSDIDADADSDGDGGGGSACSCRTAGSAAAGALSVLALVGLALTALRRR
jgi:hypothetical protein